jgi:hypothetical protein
MKRSMKLVKPAALTAALLIGALFCVDAWALGRGGHGGHGGGGHVGHGGYGGHGGHGGYVGRPGGHFYGGPVRGYHRHRGYVGGAIVVGAAPLFWPDRWYGDPYYNYYPAPYVDSPVYLPPSDAGQTTYYCDSPRGYYPNVTGCRVPWRGVIITPPPP